MKVILRLAHLLSNTDNLIEGTVWLGWFVWTASNVKNVLRKRAEAQGLPEQSAEKADKVWTANKSLFLASCSSISSGSMLSAWIEKVGLISMGVFTPIISFLGYGSGCFNSLVRLIDTCKDLNQSGIAWMHAQDPVVKSDIALGFCPKLLSISFLVCTIAWGIFGGLKLIIGGAELVMLVNLFFKYTVSSLLAYIASLLIVPLLAHDPKNLSSRPEFRPLA